MACDHPGIQLNASLRYVSVCCEGVCVGGGIMNDQGFLTWSLILSRVRLSRHHSIQTSLMVAVLLSVLFWHCQFLILSLPFTFTAMFRGNNLFLSIPAPHSRLQNRLLFHLSHKFNDEKRLMGYHGQLQDIIEDQLSLASIHYLRSHYQEAIDIYKRILLDNRSVHN